MSDTSCAARCPIVLIHGAGFRELKWAVCRGRIPRATEERGEGVGDICRVYTEIAEDLKRRGY